MHGGEKKLVKDFAPFTPVVNTWVEKSCFIKAEKYFQAEHFFFFFDRSVQQKIKRYVEPLELAAIVQFHKFDTVCHMHTVVWLLLLQHISLVENFSTFHFFAAHRFSSARNTQTDDAIYILKLA